MFTHPIFITAFILFIIPFISLFVNREEYGLYIQMLLQNIIGTLILAIGHLYYHKALPFSDGFIYFSSKTTCVGIINISFPLISLTDK